jgi:hypothetical protein
MPTGRGAEFMAALAFAVVVRGLATTDPGEGKG